ncbi:hypothetical protein GCM10009539_75140 [Cryptosporangium japonicum]|uniref:Uncharacterized protein n=1 Tax=Cryptosporangium japonicum TaxID=80872 RepID=A0ABP3ESA6_9ACTN
MTVFAKYPVLPAERVISAVEQTADLVNEEAILKPESDSAQ